MKEINPIFRKLSHKKHLAFLISLLIVLFGDIMVPVSKAEIFRPLFLIQNVWAGLFLVYEKKAWRIFIALLLPLMLSLEGYFMLGGEYDVRLILGNLYLIYFLGISVEVYRQIFQAKEVNLDMIAAVLSGFIMLCMIGSMIFLLIELVLPGSISNAGQFPEIYANLNYFSFITTLSIGYGDMVPLGYHAKKAVMLVGLLGHFYSLFVVGIVIGKFLNRS